MTTIEMGLIRALHVETGLRARTGGNFFTVFTPCQREANVIIQRMITDNRDIELLSMSESTDDPDVIEMRFRVRPEARDKAEAALTDIFADQCPQWGKVGDPDEIAKAERAIAINAGRW